MKTLVGTLRTALSCKHPDRVFFHSLKWINTSSKRETTGNIFRHQPIKNIAPILEFWQGYLRYFQVRKALTIKWNFNSLIPYFVHKFILGISSLHFRPIAKQSFAIGIQSFFY